MVEPDQLFEPGKPGGLDHADDAAGRPRQDRVLALEKPGVGQPATGLHEHQPLAGPALDIQRIGDLVDIATQDRREVGVDDRRIAARDQLDQLAGVVAGRDLREAHLARQRGDRLLVLWIEVSVHEGDGDTAHAVAVGTLERDARGLQIKRRHHLALGIEAFAHLADVAIKEFRQLDLEIEQARTVLVSDAQ